MAWTFECILYTYSLSPPPHPNLILIFINSHFQTHQKPISFKFSESHFLNPKKKKKTLAPLSPPHHMSEGTGPSPPSSSSAAAASDSSDGEPGFFATPRGCISAVLGLPSWHSTPLDHHLQPQRNLLLLLPLGQAQITP